MSWHVNFLVEEHYTLWVPTRSLHWVTWVYLNLYKLFVSPLRGASIAKLTSLFISGWTLYLTRTSFKLSNLFCIKIFLNILILVTLRFHNKLLTSIFRIWWPIHGVQRHDNVLALNSFLSLVRMSLKTTFTVKLSNLFCIKIHVFKTWTGNTSFL